MKKLRKLEEFVILGYGIKLNLNETIFWTHWLIIFYFINENPKFLLYPREAIGLRY
jgi:hypothetical protein